MSENNEELCVSDMNILITRGSRHIRTEENVSEEPSLKKQTRKVDFIKCFTHYETSKNDIWTVENSDCESCFKHILLDDVKHGVLPRIVDVLNLVLTKKAAARRVGSSQTALLPLREVAIIVSLQWVRCNVYPSPLSTVERHISTLFESYRAIKKFSSKSAGYWKKVNPFLSNVNNLFDICATDQYRVTCEKIWGVKMSADDKLFYENQKKTPPVGYCSSSVDRVWEKSMERKEKRSNRSRIEYYADIKSLTEDDNDLDDENDDLNDIDPDFIDEVATECLKRKYEDVIDDKDDDLPHRYRHVRSGLCSVRSEIYEVIKILQSKYHLSHYQAEGAIIVVANNLFGREKYGPWKHHQPKAVSDSNTLPARSNTRRVESYMEAMALHSIAEEVMNEEDTCVVWSNDGSSQSGVGAYVVQSLIINGTPRCLPTVGVFTESRETLAELMKFTLQMLSAASGYKYQEHELLKKVNFIMTDSTSHNLQVVEKVCEDLNVVDVPSQILCNIHPLMLFQRKIKEMCQQIHDKLGKEKLSDCFMVDVEFRNESFVMKAIKCLTNFINRDYSAKPWNRSSHFEEFIKPKQNMSLSLKDHRFNRLQDCATAVLHHMEDINEYLLKYPSVTNGIAILDRSFVEMEILKPILTTISLLGIHITRPFQSLLMDPETSKYSTLLIAFKKLYENLTEIPPEDYLKIDYIATFVSKEKFEKALPHKDLQNSIKEFVQLYREDIVILLQISLNMFADGFSYQKGSIFSFGPNADEECGPVLKIGAVDETELKKMDDYVPTHNILSERLVGDTNYELHIRGKSNLETVSRNMVLNKSIDLVTQKNNGEFLKYNKAAKTIKELKVKWNEKMKLMQKEGYDVQELKNLHQEKTKLSDLEFLKSGNPPGPFTKKQEVIDYVESNVPNEEKLKRLYVEVRYARMTSKTLPTTASVFRLKMRGKYLEPIEYATNLAQYLDNSQSISTVSLSDFREILQQVKEKTTMEELAPEKKGKSKKDKRKQDIHEEKQEEEVTCLKTDDLNDGDHLAVFWDEGNDRVWYLGVVDKVLPANKVVVNHFKRQNRKDSLNWVLPEKKDIQIVTVDQIIATKLNILYPLSRTRVHCVISQVDVDIINEIMTYNEKE